ncbi:MAG: HAMP domain-containing sensor histidine kinase [Pseudomonadota bacterium]
MQEGLGDYGHIAAGSPISAQRRMLEMRLKEAREKLSSDTGTRPAFDTELALNYARNKLGTTYLMPSLIVIVAGVGSLFLKPITLAMWTAFALAAHAVMMISCRYFTHVEFSPVRVKRWRQRLSLMEGINGLIWASLCFVPSTDPIFATIFSFAIALMVIGMSALNASSLPMAVLLGTIPMVAGLVGSIILLGEPFLFSMAAIAVCAEGFFILMSRRIYAQMLENLTFRLEKDGLLAEVEQTKASSDEARRRAESANLAKSRFLATMSHELRTPLNAILGFSEVMKNEILGPLPNATYKDYCEDIHKSGQHLLNLINEILDLSRIEAGKFELNEETVNLVATVEDSVRLLKLRAQSKGINLKESYEEKMVSIWADERAVRQITLNLLSNAIKFTPADGIIAVKCGWTAGGGQYLSVSDTGPGIPDDEISIVLASFGQGSNALKTAEQGAGLGLPIVKGLVDLHGGTFTFKSKLRVGTEVIITFPAERVMQALPAIKDGTKKAS